MANDFQYGINKKVNLDGFTDKEIEILKILSKKYWQVTRAESTRIPSGVYRLVLMKPGEYIKQNFNLQREVVLVFSPYENFEPRSFDAIEYLNAQELRLEEICSLIVSKDQKIDAKINLIIKGQKESRVFIPFSYNEVLEQSDDLEYLINKMRECFYSRDLFDIQDALKKDIYFFGRNDLVHDLINRHLTDQNAGIFGLRKTGKTSILYGVERGLDKKKSISIIIDCQTLHLKSYKMALYSIISGLNRESKVKTLLLHSKVEYEDDNFVMDYFLEDIEQIKKKTKKKILLIFDEIENITFDTSVSESWKSGRDFIRFWQIIRSCCQNSQLKAFTYLITGTNPRCVEVPSINKTDNPIFYQFNPIYIPSFKFDQTKEMLDRLGGYMGLQFDEEVCVNLVNDFGGHPLLIRQMCSYIHKNTTKKRPYKVISVDYNRLKKKFLYEESGFMKYAAMVLEVLENWYKDEYDMLLWLSVGDHETFAGLAKDNPLYIDHLLKYGIIFEHDGNYYFKMEALKEYLEHKNQYKRLHLTNDEKQAEISKRRNSLEPSLRNIVRRQLKITLGEEKAKEEVIKELYTAKEQKKYKSEDYKNFFKAENHKIYFSSLINLMNKNWEECFRNIFNCDVETFKAKSLLINTTRKADAHAAIISDADFTAFRGAMEWFEEIVADYE